MPDTAAIADRRRCSRLLEDVAQVRSSPSGWIPANAEGSRVRPVGHPRTEPFQVGASTDVEGSTTTTHLRAPGRAGPVDRACDRAPDSARPTAPPCPAPG